MNYRNEQAEKWLPDTVEVMLTRFDHSVEKPVAWPEGWPDLNDRRCRIEELSRSMVESFPSLIGCPSRICGKRFTVVTLPLTLSRYTTRQRFYWEVVRRIGRIDVPTDVKRERRLADQVFAFRQKGDQPCYTGTE